MHLVKASVAHCECSAGHANPKCGKSWDCSAHCDSYFAHVLGVGCKRLGSDHIWWHWRIEGIEYSELVQRTRQHEVMD